MKRLAWLFFLSTAPALVGPARAQTPASAGGYAAASSASITNALPERFEGTFTQTQQSAATVAGALSGPAAATSAAPSGIAGASADHEITGKLVWTPTDQSTRPKTFGEVDSQFYVPTDGELNVHFKMEARSPDGTCTREVSKTFAIRELPPAAFQRLYLEVAADGRYKMVLGMTNYFLPLEAAQRCTFKAAGARATVPVNEAGVVIGPQEGVLAGDAIEGATAQPIVYGVHSYSGRWEFKKVGS
jgi:hypothetical protein